MLATLFVTQSGDAIGATATLRGVLAQAQAGDVVRFDLRDQVPVDGNYTIALASTLPVAVSNLQIVGINQPNNLTVTLDGGGGSFDGLSVQAPSVTLQSLSIGDFGGNGVVLATEGNAIVNSNIGLDATGMLARGNGGNGVLITARNNTISGSAISGNGESGVSASGSLSIINSRIGTDASGTIARPNAGAGVYMAVGGAAYITRSIISGNNGAGIELQGIPFTGGSSGGSVRVIGPNYIGTNPQGAALGNAVGISLGPASTAEIGDGGDGVGNVISANRGNGVQFSLGSTTRAAATGFLVNNLIGVTPDGTGPLGNGGVGVAMGPGTSIGAGNVIGANAGGGITLASFGAGSPPAIAGSFIGVGKAGQNLGNGGDGIRSVGVGLARVTANQIAFNNGAGVFFRGGSVAIQGNSIYSNSGLGIDIDEANTSFQIPPVLTLGFQQGTLSTGVTGTVAVIFGQVQAAPSTGLFVEYFISTSPGPGGTGSGRTSIAQQAVTTGADGTASFRFITQLPVTPGQYFTATATTAGGTTSEFAIPVSQNAPVFPPIVVGGSVSATSVVVGAPATFTFTATSPANAPVTQGFILAVDLSANARLVSVTPSSGTFERIGNTLVFRFGPIASGATATIAIVVSATSPGALALNGRGLQNASSPSLIVATTAVAPVAIGPRIVSAVRAKGPGGRIRITLRFSQPLLAATATTSNFYRLNLRPSPNGPLIPLAVPVYRAATRSVVLLSQRPFRANRAVRLFVQGARPFGVTSEDGVLLSGDAAGNPASNFVTVLRNRR